MRIFIRLGITDTCPKVRFPVLLQEMQAVQETIRKILDSETRAAGVEIMYGADVVLDEKDRTYWQ